VAWQPSPEQQNDHIHSVELRLKVGGNGTISFATSSSEELEIGPFLAPGNPFAW